MSMNRTPLVVLLLAAMVIATSSLVLAIKCVDAFIETDNNLIELESISGSFGHQNTIDDDPSDKSIGATYGFQCAGECNHSAPSQGPTTVKNLLLFKLEMEESDAPGTYKVEAASSLVNKRAAQHTRDAQGDPGPPTWNAACTVQMSKPVKGSKGSDGSHGGIIALSFVHSSPTTNQAWDQSSGPLWHDQSTDLLDLGEWVHDPEDPGSKIFKVSAKCSTTFTGSAKEIHVEDNHLLADGHLQAKVSFVKPPDPPEEE